MSSSTLNFPPAGPNRVLTRSRVVGFSLLMLSMAAVTLMIWPESLRNITASNYLPHAYCYLQQPRLVWLHVTSDLLIGLAYVFISVMLGVLVHRARRDIPFSWVFIAFGLFIVTCGGTHFMEVLTVWRPFYWLAGDLKLVTAVASVATAIALPPLVPRTLDMVQRAKVADERKRNLETAHRELEDVYGKLKEFDEMKTQFFANVSHELRTPLTLILGPTEKLLRSPHLHPSERQNIEMVHRNARVLLGHVNDLLDISKFDAGKLAIAYSDVDLSRVIRLAGSYFESFAHDRNITFHVTTPPVVEAQVDSDKVQRILLNLLSNAFRFTPNGGEIRLSLEVKDQQAFISVSDSGPGVAREDRQRIFDRFEQAGMRMRGAGGTGLGLAIAKDFVNMHGGSIEVTDGHKGGALFRVVLPLHAPAASLIRKEQAEMDVQPVAEGVKVEEQRPAELTTRTVTSAQPLVLVVEDNDDMNRFVAETLSTQYRVVTARNGREALEQAFANRPDAIVSDIMMPELSGDELVRELRNSPLSSTPVILLSARADEQLRVRLLREGVQDYLMKPFFPEELLARVANVVSTKRVRDLLQQQLESHEQGIEVLAEQMAARNRELISTLEDLRRSESRFRRLFEANIIGIILADMRGKVTLANEAFLKMIGRSKQELEEGKILWTELTPPEYREVDAAALEQLAAMGTTTPFEKEYIRADGTRVPVLIGAATLEGTGTETITFVLDLYERKRTEQALRNSEKLATVGRLAGAIAHEINNPLDAVSNLLYLVASDSSISPDSKRYVALANEEINRVSHISKQMLGFYREAPAPVPINPGSIIDAVFALYSGKLQQRQIQVRRDYKYSGEIEGYPGEMRQVFSNLIINAIEATAIGGEIRARVRPSRDWKNGRAGVRVMFSDTGSGISRENREQIFEPFFTTKGEKGTGLGLWVTHGIVQKHGGCIRLRSSISPGRSGTCFSIFLPLKVEQQRARAM